MSCIRCGAEGKYVLHPLKLVACATDYSAWFRDESLSVESIEKAVGRFNVASKEDYRRHSKAFDAELLKRTQQWAKEGR